MEEAKTYAICNHCFQVNRVRLDSAQAGTCGKCKTPLTVAHGVSELTAQSLKEFIRKSPAPLVVDFWAPWCGPCRGFAPTFIQAARQFAGQVTMAKVDTEAHGGAGQDFRVQGIPTLILFKGGREVARQSGAMPLPMLAEWLQTNLRHAT